MTAPEPSNNPGRFGMVPVAERLPEVVDEWCLLDREGRAEVIMVRWLADERGWTDGRRHYRPAPGGSVVAWIALVPRSDLDAAIREAARHREALEKHGYREVCDIAACNCGDGWSHGGHAATRLAEIGEALDDRTQGVTILSAVRRLLAELDEAYSDAAKLRAELDAARAESALRLRSLIEAGNALLDALNRGAESRAELARQCDLAREAETECGRLRRLVGDTRPGASAGEEEGQGGTYGCTRDAANALPARLAGLVAMMYELGAEMKRPGGEIAEHGIELCAAADIARGWVDGIAAEEPAPAGARLAVFCATCGLQKKPIGRDAAAAAANSLCDHECPGYSQDPFPGYLWPGEEPGAAAGEEEK